MVILPASFVIATTPCVSPLYLRSSSLPPPFIGDPPASLPAYTIGRFLNRPPGYLRSITRLSSRPFTFPEFLITPFRPIGSALWTLAHVASNTLCQPPFFASFFIVSTMFYCPHFRASCRCRHVLPIASVTPVRRPPLDLAPLLSCVSLFG